MKNLLRTPLSLLSLAAAAVAQIPDGAHVVSILKVPTNWPGDSGIFVAHPRDPGQLTPITGLPDGISYANDNNPGTIGANCVLFDPSNAGVVVGVNGRSGQDLDLFRLTLNGLAVTDVQTYRLGQIVANGGGVFEMDWIDDDEVVIACGAIQGAAGAASTCQIARVDLGSGTVAPIDLGTFTTSGFVNAIAYDRGNDRVYFGVAGLAGGTSEIRAMPLTGGSPTLVATLPGSLRNLAVEPSGDMLAGLAFAPASAQPTLVRVTPAGATTTLLSTFDNVNAFAIEPTTGQIAIVGQDVGSNPNAYGLYRFDAASTQVVSALSVTRLGGGPAGAASGVDVAPCPVTYGSPTGAHAFAWTKAIDPQNLPLAGGNLFAAIDWPSGVNPVLGLYQIGTACASLPAPGGVRLYVNPLSTIAAGFLGLDANGRRSTLTMPLSACTKGVTLYAQAVHLARWRLSASDGLRAAVQ